MASLARQPRAATGAGAVELLALDFQIKLKRALWFRVNFLGHSAIALLYSFAFSIVQFFVYTGVHGYPGWDEGQMLLFQAMLIFWSGAAELLFGGVKQLIDSEVTYGNFDRFFVWPSHTLVSLFTRGTNVYALGSVLAGVVGIGVMLVRLELTPTPLTLVLFLLFFASGLMFYLSLLIFYSACTLFMVKMERLREVLERVVFFGSFPADIYSGAGKAAFLVAFPMALWVYFPVQALLGRVPSVAFASVAMSFVFLALAVRFWERQERRYSSAGG